MFTLETDRLILRDWKRSEWRDAHTYAQDAEVSKFMIWGPNSEKETKEFVNNAVDHASIRPRRSFELAMFHRESDRIIGGCGMQIVGAEAATGMIGYVLNREFWGQGITSEASRRLLRFGFEDLKLHRIYATCDTENIGSARVLEKCGMRKEAHFVQDMFIKGRWRDTFLFAILKEEWRTLK